MGCLHINDAYLFRCVLLKYDILKDAFCEYSSVAIQFGYLALFASALPAAPLMALCACLVEAKADTFKFLFLKRRPRMKGMEDIGMW
jgi:anoctamin-10